MKTACRFSVRPAFFCMGWMAIALLSGCGGFLFGPSSDEPIDVVLTFDDGPISADISHPESADAQTLLDPLNRILKTLDDRHLQAVFYIEGPGDDATGQAIAAPFAQGLHSIKNANHILGYHAYNHVPAIWDALFMPAEHNVTQMTADLTKLDKYVRDTTAGQIVLSPIFRQPYGGAIARTDEGVRAANELGLVYHGYTIDSFDWTGHPDADPDLVEKLPVHTDRDHIKFVDSVVRQQASRHTRKHLVDILMHVDSFTAEYLDEMIDSFAETFEDLTGRPVRFCVPQHYLTTTDSETDNLVVDYVLF